VLPGRLARDAERRRGADDARLRAFHQAFADRVALPMSASVLDEPVTVVEIAYDGNPRRGLTARCRTSHGREHVIALADVCIPEGGEAGRLVVSYRVWLGVDAAPDASSPASRVSATLERADDDIDLSCPVELVVMSIKERAARCRLLGTSRTVTVRSGGLWRVVPGEIVTIRPRKSWRYAGHPYLSGDVDGMHLDVAALGLVPLRLQSCGMWDPADEYWGEEDEVIDDWAQAIIAHGPRPEFEMEQVLPGEDPNDPDVDPIIESNELKDAGDVAGARRILMSLLDTDLRCLDAHAHLGNLVFDHTPAEAIRHYEVGVRTGELSLGEHFTGVLGWGLIDNRPFLRCMSGYGLCLWRLGRRDEAARVFDRMLWMNPRDNQGVRFLLPAVRDGRSWDEGAGRLDLRIPRRRAGSVGEDTDMSAASAVPFSAAGDQPASKPKPHGPASTSKRDAPASKRKPGDRR
jgi:hypothetical protein